MNIVITITSFQRLTPEQDAKKIFTTIGGTIGRGDHADLILLDHDKVISKVHARIECEQGKYYLSDTSTNGVFVNGNIEQLGRDHRHILSAGDKLRLGDYELSVDLTDEQPQAVPDDSFVVATEVFAQVSDDLVEQVIQPSPIMASSASVQAPAEPSSAKQKVVHLAQESDAFQPPSAMLPENWNYADDAHSNDAQAPKVPESKVPEVEPQPSVAVPPIPEVPLIPEVPPIPEVLTPAVPDKPAAAPEIPVQAAPVVEAPVQAAPAHTPQIPVQPAPVHAAAPVQSAPVAQQSFASPQHDALLPEHYEYSPNQSEQLVDIVPFLNGLGLDFEKNTTLRPSVMFELGRTLRDLLGGMLETMSARAELKSEFRVMQTTIRSQENNPIKFSVDTNEMIQNLFFRNLKSFLKPKDAIEEAFRDLNAHEIALMAGVQSAVNGILDELDPEMIRQKPYAVTGFGKLLPGKQNDRYWQIYTTHFQGIRRSIDEGNNRFIDIDFAKAYEDKLNELK